MRTFRYLVMVGAAAASLICPRTLLADDATPPTVVPQDRDDHMLLRDLKNAPADIQTLILAFDKTRDQYLLQQAQLLMQLKQATTPAERAAIRAQLQANRQAFLDELKTFRQDLKADLKADSANITHAELLRILQAARVASGSPVHKGR